MNDSNNSLSHCKWNCKYHIVFAPKYRRQVIYGKIKTDIGQILRKLCTWKGVEIVEAELCPDHVHMLVKIPPKYSVSQFMGYLKGKSTLMIFDKHANLKYKYGRRQFWCDGYYVDTFTYNSKKLTESEFEKRLLTTLRHFASRKGWKYMGTWERGGDTDRLHFHGILYIPEGKMAGKLVQKREYDVKKKRMVEYTENTFFQDRFGRNTFDVIDGTALTLGTAVGYIVKYMEKTGGRMICSKGLRTFIETDIDNADIVAKLREEDDKKYVLFDDFKVYKDGKELGKVSPSVLEKAKTVN